MEKDIFFNETIYPEPEKLFKMACKSLPELKESCLFVIDTNVLLLPYTISNKSIKEIEKIYTQLVKAARIKIPEQVVREFVKNRPEKIKELFHAINMKQNMGNFGLEKYPLLENDSSYKEALEIQNQINSLMKEYREKLQNILSSIKSWNWNDPISVIYGTFFTEDVIIKVETARPEIRDDLAKRILHKIPPGYKDSGKEDEGIGDLLIWYAILQLGKKGHDVIFVSGDEKSDWFYRSNNQSLYPRFELIDEFRRLSGGKTFHILKFSDFLQLFDAERTIIQEIRIEEELSISDVVTVSDNPLLSVIQQIVTMANEAQREDKEITDDYIINVKKASPDDSFMYTVEDFSHLMKYARPRKAALFNYLSLLKVDILRKVVAIMYVGRGDTDDLPYMQKFVSDWNKDGCIHKLIEKSLRLSHYLMKGLRTASEKGIDINAI